MPLLFWDRPEKKMSVEEWKKISFDGGPPGGYVPNISNKDVHKWRAKIIGKSTKHPTIEVRHQTKRGSQITIIVSPGNGYKYKFYKQCTKAFTEKYLKIIEKLYKKLCKKAKSSI